MSSRPKYETEHDRQTEESIINDWSDHYNYRWQRLPGGYALIDYALLDQHGFVRAVAEVKDRPGWKYNYKDIFLNLQKARELYHYHLMGLVAVFVVRAEDRIRHVRVNDELSGWNVCFKGRTDRDDWQDIEPCYLVPIDAFTVLPGASE